MKPIDQTTAHVLWEAHTACLALRLVTRASGRLARAQCPPELVSRLDRAAKELCDAFLELRKVPIEVRPTNARRQR